MVESLHNPHLAVDLVVQNVILHQPTFVQFLASIDLAIIFGCEFIDGSEGTLANQPRNVILRPTVPLHTVRVAHLVM